MKMFVLWVMALTLFGLGVISLIYFGLGIPEEQYKKAMLEFAASDNYHAEVCRDGDKLMAYRTLISETQRVPIIRIIGQIVLDEKSYIYDVELLKGQSKFIQQLDGSEYYSFTGSEVRTLARSYFNMTTKEASDRSVKGYSNETIRVVFDIPYVAKDQFNIRDYSVEFFPILKKLFVTDKWTCQKVDDEIYITLVQ